MSLINVNLNVVAYADEPKSVNPQVKFADLSWSLQGQPTGTPKEVPIALGAGETKTIMSTVRSLSFTIGTSFSIAQVTGTTNAQLQGDFGARTARDDGDGTTEWSLTRTNKLVRLQYTGTGTAPTFGTMTAGDGITLSTGFNALNQGDFTIVNVGVDFVEFTNAVASDETVTTQVEIYSSGPVQIGDSLDLTSSAFAYPNRGMFEVTRVTDSFVEFSNPDAVPETGITGVASTDLIIYQEAFQWLLIALDGKAVVRLNQDTGNGNEIEPLNAGDLVKSPGLLLKRGKVFEVEIENTGLDLVSGVALLSE